jgi:hypothetical protein
MGAVAGAAGTVALDVVTYLDMAVRGRPPSELPSSVAEKLAGDAGIGLGDDERARNRSSGIGALLGYATGIGVGMVYGALRARTGPPPGAALALSLAAMAGSDVPATALGLTDPRRWGPSGWVADVIPHLAYGFVTAAAFDLVASRRRA